MTMTHRRRGETVYDRWLDRIEVALAAGEDGFSDAWRRDALARFGAEGAASLLARAEYIHALLDAHLGPDLGGMLRWLRSGYGKAWTPHRVSLRLREPGDELLAAFRDRLERQIRDCTLSGGADARWYRLKGALDALRQRLDAEEPEVSECA